MKEELKPMDALLIAAILFYSSYAALVAIKALENINAELKEIHTTYQSTLK